MGGFMPALRCLSCALPGECTVLAQLVNVRRRSDKAHYGRHHAALS